MKTGYAAFLFYSVTPYIVFIHKSLFYVGFGRWLGHDKTIVSTYKLL